MTHMLDIPKDRKRTRPIKLCLLIAVTAMLYMTISAGFAGASANWVLDVAQH